MKKAAAIKVGLLTILATIILLFSIAWLKGRSISVGERIEVNFKDIDGMRPGSAVQMMGMRIGQVDEIVPIIKEQNSYIRIRFVITEPEISIPDASIISIQQSGIIGEKFLEITPPPEQTVYLPIFSVQHPVKKDDEVQLFINGKYIEVGKILATEVIEAEEIPFERQKKELTGKVYKISYVVNKPGIIIPDNSTVKAVTTTKTNQRFIQFTPPENIIVKMPEEGTKYTIEEPLRIKKFIDIQMEAAVALKETNDKINSLFSNEFISDVRHTVENTKDLTEKASDIVTQVSDIIESSREDIKVLIASSTELAENMTELTANINQIVGDEEFRQNLILTVNTIKESSEKVSSIIKESQLEESFVNLNKTSKDLSEIVQYVNNLTKNENISDKIDETVVNLNTSLVKLTKIIDTVEELTVDEKDKLKKLLNDSSETFDNLKDVSDKLNSRFMLLKLLF